MWVEGFQGLSMNTKCYHCAKTQEIKFPWVLPKKSIWEWASDNYNDRRHQHTDWG